MEGLTTGIGIAIFQFYFLLGQPSMNISSTVYPIFRVTQANSPWFYLFLLAGVLALQFALVSFTFPLDELTSDKPIFYYDTAFHWYEIWFAQALSESGRWVGYDPYFSAGLVNGVTLNMSAKAAAVLAILAGPDMTATQAFKWFSSVSAMIAPACITVACYWFGIPRFVALLAAFFSIVTWWATDFRAYYSICSRSAGFGVLAKPGSPSCIALLFSRSID